MKRHVRQISLCLFGSMTMLLVSSTASEAGLFCWPGHPWFGSPTVSYYRGANYGPVTRSSFFAPRRVYYARTYWPGRSICVPCVSVCSPCACPTDVCSVTSKAGSSRIQPTPEDSAGLRTYRKEEAPMDAQEKQEKQEAGDSPFGPRKGDGFSAPKKNDDADESNGKVERETLKPPVDPEDPFEETEETVIKRRKPAPVKTPSEDGIDGKDDADKQVPVKNDAKDAKSETEENEIETEKTPEAGESRIRPLNVDARITWRTTPRRTRLNISSTFVSPKIVRSQVRPNTDWVPVSQGAKIVSK